MRNGFSYLLHVVSGNGYDLAMWKTSPLSTGRMVPVLWINLALLLVVPYAAFYALLIIRI